MAENKSTAGVDNFQKKGGYPAGSKPASQVKPPPASVTKKVTTATPTATKKR